MQRLRSVCGSDLISIVGVCELTVDLRLQSTITADENTKGLFILQNILRRYKASTAKNAAICAAIWEGKKNYT